MSHAESNPCPEDNYQPSSSRLREQIYAGETSEGCPVLEEIGTVCGETNSLHIFKEFRQLYDECIRKFEDSDEDASILKKLAPLRKFIEDLWEQNAMLVETVEELEQEATCTVTNLQDKLNRSCQKICEYEEDINSLVELLRRYPKSDALNLKGLKFNTLNPTFELQNSCKSMQDDVERSLAYECQPSVYRNPETLKNFADDFSCVKNSNEEFADNCESDIRFLRQFDTRSAYCIDEEVSGESCEDQKLGKMTVNRRLDNCVQYMCEDIVDQIDVNLKFTSDSGHDCECGCTCMLDSDEGSDN